MLLFGKFKGQKNPITLGNLLDRNGNWKNRSSSQLLDPNTDGSLAHYFEVMSYGALHLADNDNDNDIVSKWFEAKQTSESGYGIQSKKQCTNRVWFAGVSTFVQEVIEAADADPDVDLTDYDGNGDGKVDLVAVFTPREFGDVCGSQGTVLYNKNYTASDGTSKQVEVIITSDHRKSFPFFVGVLAHEYGHVMGLPELFDRTSQEHDSTDVADRVLHSAGVGFWGVMGKGPNGYVETSGVVDGPAPMTAWSRAAVGWLTPQMVTEDTAQPLQIQDINSSNNQVYKIPMLGKTTEYFLLSNRQRGTKGNYFDHHLPKSGLLIWHIDEDVRRGSDVNRHEQHKRVDVECADGLFDNGGFGTSGNSKNSISGGDNLDYWSPSDTYSTRNTGNIGDATDVWDGSPDYRHFTPYSNPSTAGYNGNTQDMFTGIAVRNITQNRNGSMSVTIRFIPLAPENLTATVSTTVANQVDLSWSEPTSNGATIKGYEYSDGSHGEDGNELWGELDWKKDDDTNKNTASLENLEEGLLTFKVRAVSNNDEKGRAASTGVYLWKITGTAKVSVPESVNDSGTAVGPVDVGVYRNTNPNPNAPVWSLIGADASTFTLVQASGNASNERTLQFKEPPNYEVPLAGGGYKTTYNVGVVVRDVPLGGAVGATDGAQSYTLLVTVSVVNVEEAGSVELSPQPPHVGVPLVARLTDPDEGLTFTGASWAWYRRAGATASWQSVSSGAAGAATNYPELSSYTPSSSDVGYHLRATVNYTDNHGPNKSAEGATSAPVFGPPTATATTGYRRIHVDWPPVPSATGYDVQVQSKPFDRGMWPSAWSSLATNSPGRPRGTSRRYAHTGVSPDSLYRYQMRSRTGTVVSAWSAPTAGVQPLVGSPEGFSAEAGAGQVTLRWTGPDHASITKWRYRDVTALGGRTRGGWQDAAVSGSASTEWSAPVADLTPGQAYRFQVRAVNGAGGGQPSAVSNAVTPWLARPTGGSVSKVAGPALEVAWSPVASATGYEVQGQRRFYEGGAWPATWTQQQANGAQPYVHRGVDADSLYRYRVRARMGAVGSAWSDMLPGVGGVQPPPSAPTGLTATAGNRQVTLTWTGPTHTSITGWQYQRGHISEPTTAWSGWLPLSSAATTRTFTVTSALSNGRSYVFQVRAGNAGGWSAAAQSDTVLLVRPADTPGRVALSTTAPQVGDDLTATLIDPDAPSNAGFSWAYLVPAGAAGANGEVSSSRTSLRRSNESGGPMAPACDAL